MGQSNAVVHFTYQNSSKILKKSTYKEYVRNLPAFTIYGDNYFITGTTTHSDAFTATGSDAKFEIGFKQRLYNKDLLLELIPFVTYRQKAFWNIYQDSFPFRETNYNPTLGFTKLFFKGEEFDYSLHFAFEHESNGRDGMESRSWNFFSLAYYKPINNNLNFRAKAWIPVGDLRDNEDIISYRGYFNFGITCRASQNLFVEVDVQPAYDSKLQGNIKAGLSYKISKNSNQYIYLQYFGGYSEDLIQYDESVSNIRLGIVFKDLPFKISQQ